MNRGRTSAPLFIIIQAATGLSIPPLKRETRRPWEP